MGVSKSGVTQPIGRVSLPQGGTVFTGKRYTASAVDLLFKKMRAKTPPFHGVLTADADARRLYLVVVDNEPYAAGEEQRGIFVPLTLRGLFTALQHMPSAALTFGATDPLFLKSLLTVIQQAPSTEGSTDLMEIGGVVEHLKKTPNDRLLVVGRQSEMSLFYFKGGHLIFGYFADPKFEAADGPVEARLLAFVRDHAGRGVLSLHIFPIMTALPAEDGVFERGAWPDGLVEHFTRPVPHLLIGGSDGGTRRFELAATTVTMGRGEDNDLVIEDPAISRRHLIFRLEGDGYSVEDCGSRNGTLYNGAPLTKAPLAPGVELQIGTCLIRFFGATAPVNTESSVAGHGEETVRRPAGGSQPESSPPPAPSVLPAPTWTLEIARPDGSRERRPLTGALTTIGRTKADLVLTDTRVSRRHGELEVGPDGVAYRDTGSTNGSLLNGRTVTSAVLKPGDVLTLGETSLTILQDAA
jgi:pSer/pThr/pTyr-binding forkhead associated (FHA) protein